eukprot:COSAG01_NODE_74351_length_217_cov_17.610169_2_plen_23_part_01
MSYDKLQLLSILRQDASFAQYSL